VTQPVRLVERLDALIAEHARRAVPVDADPTWREIGIDSLGLVSFAVACEDELGVEVPDRVLARVRGPAQLRAWLEAAPGRRA
jgi:acyl carrier protein